MRRKMVFQLNVVNLTLINALKKCLIGLPIVAFPFQYFSYLSKKEIGLPAVVYLMH